MTKRVCIGLVLLNLGAYFPVAWNGFVNWDDDQYVTQNAHIQSGLTVAGLRWALTTDPVQWHPLTWMSLQLDRELFGDHAGGYHLVNVLLHTANSLLLFLIFRNVTGAFWASALLAAFFAVHPLHVESAAWVTERKDVLSTFFWLLTLAAYFRYARHPGVARYLIMLPLMGLGLAAKSTLVTLPLTFLLLDFWPLRRLRYEGWTARPVEEGNADARLIAEKVPLILLAAFASYLTYVNRDRHGYVVPLARIPLEHRLGYALIYYCRYLFKTFWPSELACYYPHARGAPPDGEVLAAGIFLAGVTVCTLWQLRKRPYLIVGWLWFLITLLPVIGLVQVGGQDIADHFMYVPLIGILIMAAWSTCDLASKWPIARKPLTGVVALALTTCVILSNRQARVWHDSVSLWQQAERVTAADDFTCYFLVKALVEEQRYAEAAQACEEYLKREPFDLRARGWYSDVLRRMGQSEAAQKQEFEVERLRQGQR